MTPDHARELAPYGGSRSPRKFVTIPLLLQTANPLTDGSTDLFRYTPLEMTLNVGLATALGLIVALVYRATHKGLSYSQSFTQTIFLVAIIVALVMMVIGGSLSRAFALVGALSIIGLPPAAGMWSKLLLVKGTAASGDWLLVTAFLVSTLLNISYLLSIPARAFLRPLSEEAEAHPHGEAPVTMRIAMVATATLTVALFLVPDPLFELVSMMTGGVTP